MEARIGVADPTRQIGELGRWLELVTPFCGCHIAKASEGQPFSGWIRPLEICGLKAADIGCNTRIVERTLRDARGQGGEYFTVGLQRKGSADIAQNERIMRADPGDIVLLDGSRPMRYQTTRGPNNFLSLHLPRSSCIAHFGFEPEGGVRRRGNGLAARLLVQIVECAHLENGSLGQQWEPHFDMVVYDLVRSLLGVDDRISVSRHSDRLFERISRVVDMHFTDPDFGPAEAAAEAGISLRYLQKLFTRRGTTCGQAIQSLRLRRAFVLLKRYGGDKGGPAIAEIALACGFRDLNHFHRVFRQRFGHTPGAVRIGKGEAAGGEPGREDQE
jgi:AraC-like DNA-binding protein